MRAEGKAAGADAAEATGASGGGGRTLYRSQVRTMALAKPTP
jgi:hypothetical protein